MAFPSPATAYAEQRISLADMVSLSPHSTYFLRSDSDYRDAGILKGSVLVVDRALIATHGHIIIANVDNELVIRRLLLNPVPALQELGGDSVVTALLPDEELPVWGVIAYVLTDMAGVGFTQSVPE